MSLNTTMTCTECSKDINYVRVYALEENIFKVYPVGNDGMKRITNWELQERVEQSEIDIDAVCPECGKLIKRFDKRTDLEKFLYEKFGISR